jgi:UDP-glucose 4-epimerase
MRVVITGGLGHIGSRLLEFLGQKGYFTDIIIVDNLLTERYISLFNLPINTKFHLIRKDVRELAAIDFQKFGPIELIIHLAALTNPAKLQNQKDEVLSNNLEATNNIVRISNSLNSKLIFTSSTNVYSSMVGIVSEATQLQTTNTTYSEVKLLEEDFIRNETINGYAILRLGTISGISPGMRFHTAVNKFCYDSIMGAKINVWNGAQELSRPYLSLDDLCNSIEHIYTLDLFDRNIYNIVTNHLSISEICTIISSHLITDIEINIIDSPYEPEKNFQVDTTKISNTNLRVIGDVSRDIQKTLELFRGFYVG